MGGFGGDQAPHKALLDLAGVPMIARVLNTLAASPSIERIVVSIDDESVIDEVPTARDLTAAGRLVCRVCGPSPAGSVAAHLARADAGRIVLVTTADHPLLTSRVVETFLCGVAGNPFAACRVEGYRKTPWKMAALFGPRTLAAFALRRLDLGAAMQRISDVVGCPVGAVELSDAECAIDVDSSDDARVVEQILRERSRS
jgi:CTP:molybdopterin cytidylyltransferase MocA